MASKNAPKKPPSKLMPAKLANLDTESTKKRNRRTKDKEKKATADIAAEAAALRAVQHKADVDDKEPSLPRHTSFSC
ncbi:hypothetical protein D1007_41233 [Hordeum vulgare]|nr:hypothetical protein D1007_41233 [Hordeum vulgare]